MSTSATLPPSAHKRTRTTPGFERAAWGALLYTLVVIVWGAFVRATGSGAGCGSHWPLCNGEVIPRAPEVATLIELAHRVSSGLSLLAVVAVWLWARVLYRRGELSRLGWRAAQASLVLMVLEALVGAGLVLLELVAHDRSVTRTVSIAVHLINTSLLTGAMLSVALAARTASAAWSLGRTPKLQREAWLAVAGFLIVAAAGAITALGDTLFPAETLAQGIAHDLSAGAHFLVQLRVIHPIAAVAFVALASVWVVRASKERASELAPSVYLPLDGRVVSAPIDDEDAESAHRIRRYSKRFALAVGINLLIGIATLLSLAPIVLQLLHLLGATIVWLTLIAFLFELGLVRPAHTR